MHRWAIGWVCAAAVTAACSSGSGGSSTSASQACSDLAQNICQRIDACAHLYLQIDYGDVSTCTSRTVLTCPQALSATGTTATPADVESCAQAYASASCDDLLAGNTPSSCQIHGTLSAGTACGSDIQCSGDQAYCKIGAGSKCGACSTRAAAGGQCTAGSDCQPGLACPTSTAAQGTCTPYVAEGGACDTTHPCKGTLICSGGTCATPVEAGAACSAAHDACDLPKGAVCNTSTMVCAQVQTVMAGGTCGVVSGGYALCVSGATCAMGAAGSGTCQAAAADGATCGSNGAPCLAPATCINDTCTLPDPSSCH